MKQLLFAISVAALVAGCAHQGGVRNDTYQERGHNEGYDAFGREPAAAPMDREFRGMRPPGTQPLDPAVPR